jgi:probable DNA repair protein
MGGEAVDNWLRGGGLIVAASDRAARGLLSSYHQRRRAEGLTAWPMPGIQTWTSFVSKAREERTLDGTMLLSPTQEEALWADIIAREEHLATLLEGPRHRLAAMAMQAHALICSYAPRYLHAAARGGWDRDAKAFSGWLSAFDDVCRENNFISSSRAPLELIAQLQNDPTRRPPLLAFGFDRLLPMQRAALDAWGHWQQVPQGPPAREVSFYSAIDSATELAACANWCMHRLAEDPKARLLVISQGVATHRGEIERAFLRSTAQPSGPLFEFSLGIALSQIPLAQASFLVLRWLDGSLRENELDWLFSTGLNAAGPEESVALQAYLRALRRRGLARTEWTLDAFIGQSTVSVRVPPAWLHRMTAARRRLIDMRNRRLSPLDWAALVPQLLQTAGLAGERRLSSAEFQAWRRWEQAVDTCGSLGFDGRRIGWLEFLSVLSRTLDELLYSPESSDAPIQIAGPAESAGLTADAIWFLGAEEDRWPTAGSTHPFLPLHVQRESGMPHAAPQNDWDLAQAITTRLSSSAPVVQFSYARQRDDAETRPSRLVAQIAGPPQPLPSRLVRSSVQPLLAASVCDSSHVPFPPDAVRGGSSVLTAQSQCSFKAFATARLGAQAWEPAEFGLTAAQRGLLLHAVLHAIWAGPPAGLSSRDDLLARPDLHAFVAGHVHRVLCEEIPRSVRESLPERYLGLEGQRLIRVVSNWLEYEASRLPFTVAETEADRAISIGGLSLKLRLDRIDRLHDGSLLVIDYKTGDVTPKAWELPRPDDVQLPLYAGFALDQEPGGLLFAKVRAGQACFGGHVRDASATLFAGLNGNTALSKKKLTDDQMWAWRDSIEQLARDFVAGRAVPDPREYPATCERCDLLALCRIQEIQDHLATENGNEEAADE